MQRANLGDTGIAGRTNHFGNAGFGSVMDRTKRVFPPPPPITSTFIRLPLALGQDYRSRAGTAKDC